MMLSLTLLLVLVPQLAAQTLSGNDTSQIFQKTQVTSCGPERLGTSWTQNSLLSCAVTCKQRYNSSCQSFMYNTQSARCTPGSGLRPEDSPPSSVEGQLYLTDSLKAYQRFSVRTFGNETACVAHQTWPLNYTQAKDACACLGARLFVAKSQSKFDLFANIVGPGSTNWMGLDDLAVEGSFRWVDDGQVINSTLKAALFNSGQPDNAGGIEDCVFVMGIPLKLNDVPCQATAPYVCEKLNC